MSRVIKFRAWNPLAKGMIRVFWPKQETEKELIVMQFTGLFDREGKEIWEGDIFNNHQASVNTVIWFGGQWCYENYHAGALPLWPDNKDCEILGNIYESPELLKGE